MIKTLFKDFSPPTNLAVLNGVLIALIVLLNINFQAFCIPSTWAIIVLTICFTNTILYPILDKTKFSPFTSFINGVSLFVFIYSAKSTSRYFFITAIFLCIGIIVFIGQEYKKAIHAIEKLKESNYTELEKSFMTEKILGMHFIYHTRYCEFDGWRPPKHEPILIIGMWLNRRIDPLNVDLKTRLLLYKKFFPNNKYKFECSCAISHRQDYNNDNLWKN